MWRLTQVWAANVERVSDHKSWSSVAKVDLAGIVYIWYSLSNEEVEEEMDD